MELITKLSYFYFDRVEKSTASLIGHLQNYYCCGGTLCH